MKTIKLLLLHCYYVKIFDTLEKIVDAFPINHTQVHSHTLIHIHMTVLQAKYQAFEISPFHLMTFRQTQTKIYYFK